MTSKPASRARRATCSAAFECPSNPGLATSKRSFRAPMRAAAAATFSRTVDMDSGWAPPIVAEIPVGGRYSPNTSRKASAHSPVVTAAFAAAIDAGRRFSVAVAPPALEVIELLCLGGGIDPLKRLHVVELRKQGRGLTLLVLVKAHNDL